MSKTQPKYDSQLCIRAIYTKIFKSAGLPPAVSRLKAWWAWPICSSNGIRVPFKSVPWSNSALYCSWSLELDFRTLKMTDCNWLADTQLASSWNTSCFPLEPSTRHAKWKFCRSVILGLRMLWNPWNITFELKKNLMHAHLNALIRTL